MHNRTVKISHKIYDLLVRIVEKNSPSGFKVSKNKMEILQKRLQASVECFRAEKIAMRIEWELENT